MSFFDQSMNMFFTLISGSRMLSTLLTGLKMYLSPGHRIDDDTHNKLSAIVSKTSPGLHRMVLIR